ncbi:hypothetical protein QTQ03_13960 [Micromonospora sp. WMMA1363]|uniref:hypothetical protein n=1 Tax=Micromonospora sp. WMMA1363 TaxID=3053985 RepID=UPI00259D2405|nr:hypothetical protein [Micromonospora sp. WMMA1363]MDM4720633.1 hypothetical protein [Micromonospora sp. WMMA1363]
MARRVVVALLGPVAWAPPGIDPVAWRTALADDVVDLLTTLNGVDPAVAVTSADRWLADAVLWPGTTVYEVPEPTVDAVLAAVVGDGRGGGGYDQAVVIAGDAPDLPGLIIGKLLRPLTSRPVAVAPAEGSVGLLGLAMRLPVPEWLPAVDLDTARPAAVRAAAPRPGDLAVTSAWHRLRGPADLARLNPALDGWDTTRALLAGVGRPG